MKEIVSMFFVSCLTKIITCVYVTEFAHDRNDSRVSWLPVPKIYIIATNYNEREFSFFSKWPHKIYLGHKFFWHPSWKSQWLFSNQPTYSLKIKWWFWFRFLRKHTANNGVSAIKRTTVCQISSRQVFDKASGIPKLRINTKMFFRYSSSFDMLN